MMTVLAITVTVLSPDYLCIQEVEFNTQVELILGDPYEELRWRVLSGTLCGSMNPGCALPYSTTSG
jgi:hypothetical protein